MANSQTTNLELDKQDTGDNVDWGALWNSNCDKIDAMFPEGKDVSIYPLTGTSHDPLTDVQGDYVGQRYFDTVYEDWWTCTAERAGGTYRPNSSLRRSHFR